MRRVVIDKLTGRQFCGERVDDYHVCLRRPGHTGECSKREIGEPPLSDYEKLYRRYVAVTEERNSQSRRIEHLVERIRKLEARRQWVERYIGFRIEHRIRGSYRRARRYVRYVKKYWLGIDYKATEDR